MTIPVTHIKKVALCYTAALLLSYLLYQLDFSSIKWFFIDSLQKIIKTNTLSNNITLIKLPLPIHDDTYHAQHLELKDSLKEIQKISNFKPAAILYTYAPRFIMFDKNIDYFFNKTSEINNFYWIPFTSEHEEYSVLKQSDTLKKLTLFTGWFPPDRFSLARDNMHRRIVYIFNNAETPAAAIANKFINQNHKGSIIRTPVNSVNTNSILIRYRPHAYKFLDINEIEESNIKNKIVILGYDQQFSSFYVKNTPYGNDILNPLVLASAIDTLIIKDNPKVFSDAINILIASLFTFCILLITLSIRPPYAFLSSIVYVLIIFIICVFVYWLTSWVIDFGTILLNILFLQYVLIPYLIIKYIKSVNKENIANKLALAEAKIVAKSAKVDFGFRLAVNLAHDIRSPLLALKTIQRLLIQDQKPQIQQLFDSSIERIERISEDLLNKYKIRQDTKSIKNMVEINSVISSLVNDFQKTTQHIINFKQLDKPLFSHISQVDLERSISNLITNSLEAVTTDGRIDIQILRNTSFIEIVITDNGPGIPDHIKSSLFKKKITSKGDKGHGLGLYESNNIFKKHGGNLLYTNPAKGSQFIARLPINNKKQQLFVNRVIVVIEDDEGALSIFNSTFEKYNCEVYCYPNAEAFLNFYEKNERNFSEQSWTLFTDLIFENHDLTGFDLFSEFQSKANLILCTSLADNIEIQKICDKYRATLISKQFFLNTQITVLPN